jgi:phosphoribosylamine-glycine ligase
VLGVCASERTLQETMTTIYGAAVRIQFDGVHYRRDIGTVRMGAEA